MHPFYYSNYNNNLLISKPEKGSMPKTLFLFFLTLFSLFFPASCVKLPQMPREQALQLKNSATAAKTIIDRCLIKRGEERTIGKAGGYWNLRIGSDPMTFNTLTARDGDSRAVIDWLSASLVEYDPFNRTWSSGLADFTVENDLKKNKQRVFCTLKPDAVWYLPKQNTTIPITSNDLAFWFNEIEGDAALQHPGYAGQFVKMPDGSEEKIQIEIIDEKKFCYHFPRISSDPILEIAGEFGASFIYAPVKEKAYQNRYQRAYLDARKKGLSKTEAEATAKEIARSYAAASLNNLHSIDSDPKELPTCGAFYIESYQPGLKIVLKRNPFYYKKDSQGNPLPYLDGLIYHIIRDEESALLEFLKGTTDSIGIPHEKLQRMFDEKKRQGFDIYFGGTALASGFICMNQNPAAMPAKSYQWFIQKEFRQAISSLINRKEIISQIYLGLAEPNTEFFNKANRMYNPQIKMQYDYNPSKAMELLKKIGMHQSPQGILLDATETPVEFSFTYPADNDTNGKIASIVAHNLQEAGIQVKLKPTDFQKIVNSLIKTYDWEMTIIALSGNYWPTGGANVWQSSGNFHLWHPNQEKPATPWEAKVDELYQLGRFASEDRQAYKYWNEYQQLILEQMPLIYLPYTYAFRAYQKKWANITYDLLGGHDEGTNLLYVYLK